MAKRRENACVSFRFKSNQKLCWLYQLCSQSNNIWTPVCRSDPTPSLKGGCGYICNRMSTWSTSYSVSAWLLNFKLLLFQVNPVVTGRHQNFASSIITYCLLCLFPFFPPSSPLRLLISKLLKELTVATTEGAYVEIPCLFQECYPNSLDTAIPQATERGESLSNSVPHFGS